MTQDELREELKCYVIKKIYAFLQKECNNRNFKSVFADISQWLFEAANDFKTL